MMKTEPRSGGRFEADRYEIRTVRPEAVVMEGEIISGSSDAWR